MKCLVCVVALLAVACRGSPEQSDTASAPSPAIDPATVGTVTGQVVLDGTAPTAEVIRLDGDPKCVSLARAKSAAPKTSSSAQGNTLQNVFVYVKDGLPPRLYPVPRSRSSSISRSAATCRACSACRSASR